MSKKPGVMVYFDVLPALKTMTNANKGILFEAILEYGQHRRLMALPAKLQTVWPMIQQRLDTDDFRYCQTVTKKAYAAYARWARNKGQEPMDFTQWQEEKGYALIDEDYEPTVGTFVPTGDVGGWNAPA